MGRSLGCIVSCRLCLEREGREGRDTSAVLDGLRAGIHPRALSRNQIISTCRSIHLARLPPAIPPIPPIPSPTRTMSIPLYISNHKAYIWDPQHAATLRVTHHICGLATGTLPGVGQQNLFLGLPLVVMPDEVVLLVEERICHLVYTPRAFRAPTAQEIAHHTAGRMRDVQEMQVAAVVAAEAKKQAFAAKREGGKGKRAERSRDKGGGGGVPGEDSLFAPETLTTTTTNPSSQPYFTTVPAHPTASHPWFSPSPLTTYTTLPAAHEAGVWTYPRTQLERARCATYREVWSKGMYMGQGVKFGGEFLVYPGTLCFSIPLLSAKDHEADAFFGFPAGDPLRYHSHFVTTTIPTPTTPIRPLELVAWGRLGTATKKAHLVCCVDLGEEEAEAEPEVQCYSLEWANFG